jgi:hypothetical protein
MGCPQGNSAAHQEPLKATSSPASIGPNDVRAIEHVATPLVRVCDGADGDDAGDRTNYLNDHWDRSAIKVDEAIDRDTSVIIPDSNRKFAGSSRGTGCFSPPATFLRRSKIHQ